LLQIFPLLQANELWPEPAARARLLVDKHLVQRISNDEELETVLQQLFDDVPAHIEAQIHEFHLGQICLNRDTDQFFAVTVLKKTQRIANPFFERLRKTEQYKILAETALRQDRKDGWKRKIPESINKGLGPQWLDDFDPERHWFPRDRDPRMSKQTLQTLKNALLKQDAPPRWLGEAVRLVLQKEGPRPARTPRFAVTPGIITKALDAVVNHRNEAWQELGARMTELDLVDESRVAELPTEQSDGESLVEPWDTPVSTMDEARPSEGTPQGIATTRVKVTKTATTVATAGQIEPKSPRVIDYDAGRFSDLQFVGLRALARNLLGDTQFALGTDDTTHSAGTRWQDVGMCVGSETYPRSTVLEMERAMNREIVDSGPSVYRQLMAQDIGLWAASSLLLKTIELTAVPIFGDFAVNEVPSEGRSWVLETTRDKINVVLWRPCNIAYLPIRALSDNKLQSLKSGKHVLVFVHQSRVRQLRITKPPTMHNAVALRNPVARALRRELEWSDPAVQAQVSCLLRHASAHPRRTAFEKAIEADSQSATFNACMATTWIMVNDDRLRDKLLRIVRRNPVARSFTFLANERILRDE
jgi:hypothetical protein